jgi:hypothetical protein
VQYKGGVSIREEQLTWSGTHVFEGYAVLFEHSPIKPGLLLSATTTSVSLDPWTLRQSNGQTYTKMIREQIHCPSFHAIFPRKSIVRPNVFQI